jgi:hypothetical protein
MRFIFFVCINMVAFRKCNTSEVDDRKLLLYVLDNVFDDFHEMKGAYVKSLENECDIKFIIHMGEIIGTVEIKKQISRGLNLLRLPGEKRKTITMFASFGILPEYQKKGLGFRVMKMLLDIYGPMLPMGTESEAGSRLYDKFRSDIIN